MELGLSPIYPADDSTCVEGATSTFADLHAGVPQGTVLGPLLFLCYVNDLPSIISPKCSYRFADDTALLAAQSRRQLFTTSAETQAALNRVLSWSHDWHVTFNALKSADLAVMGSRRGFIQPPDLTMQGSVIPKAESVLHLGVHISGDLRRSTHVRHLHSKVVGKIGLLRHLCYRLPLFVIATIFTRALSGQP